MSKVELIRWRIAGLLDMEIWLRAQPITDREN